MSPTVQHATIGRDSPHPLRIPRIITGLWQLAGGHDADIDIHSAASEMGELAQKGLTAFDMADRASSYTLHPPVAVLIQ